MLAISACNKKEDDSPTMVDFDRSEMLRDIADNVILPAHQNFLREATALSVALSGITATTGATTVEAAQIQWLKCTSAWKVCQLFNVGTAQESYLHNKVHTWPVNEEFVNTFIMSNETLDERFISTKGSSSKGLAAIEYLLFNANGTAAVVDSLTNNQFAERKRDYLKALGQNLKSVAADLNNIWSQDGRNYYSEFTSSSGTGLGTGTNMLINEMANMIEMMLHTKVGKPLGKHLNNEPHPELAEAFRSRASLELLKSNLQVLKQAFLGGLGKSAIGIDDHLDAVDAKYDDMLLSQKVNMQFEATSTALNNITPDLESAVSNYRQPAEDAYNEIRELLVLFKTDIVSNLSITLTLNDNDGD